MGFWFFPTFSVKKGGRGASYDYCGTFFCTSRRRFTLCRIHNVWWIILARIFILRNILVFVFVYWRQHKSKAPVFAHLSMHHVITVLMAFVWCSVPPSLSASTKLEALVFAHSSLRHVITLLMAFEWLSVQPSCLAICIAFIFVIFWHAMKNTITCPVIWIVTLQYVWLPLNRRMWFCTCG